MRERRLAKVMIGGLRRITPAYAGKTCMYLTYDEYVEGSPPLMRERQLFHLHLQSCYRITPAYAGKTWIAGQAHASN